LSAALVQGELQLWRLASAPLVAGGLFNWVAASFVLGRCGEARAALPLYIGVSNC
jgi:hypothetical protein